eukprot:TRINITY_DN12459_c0_g1_i3.p1 TRINITY_DN12459_c0_g1~~TRINITY_DN12459_c0_g1_i3.p1  ORF type:complete len:371 (-),score=91.09 TRINITY_DN12459_c0_g1_i3:662-1774(-)
MMRHLFAVSASWTCLCIVGSGGAAAEQNDAESWSAMVQLARDWNGFVHDDLELIRTVGGKGVRLKTAVPKDEKLFSLPYTAMISRLHVNASTPNMIVGKSPQVPPIVSAVEKLGLAAEWELQPFQWQVAPDAPVAAWLALVAIDGQQSEFGTYVKSIWRGSVGHPCELPLETVEKLTDDELLAEVEANFSAMPPYYDSSPMKHWKMIRDNLPSDILKNLSFKSYLRALYILITRSFSMCGTRTMVPVVDFLNHAHDCNTHYTQNPTCSGNFELWAKRDIEAGEELTIEYTTVGNPGLYGAYGFTLPPEAESRGEWDWWTNFTEDFPDAHLPHSALQLTTDMEALCKLKNKNIRPLDVFDKVVDPAVLRGA